MDMSQPNTPNAHGRASAVLITAPASGQGKSIITAALARMYHNAGHRVRVFKHGPDYLDPMLQEQASGAPAYQLHPWMTGTTECRWRLACAAADADIILVEGSTGLFDGDASSADLAVLAGLPAVPVIDATGMGQTFGALALGLDHYRKDLAIHGVIANRVASDRHREVLTAGLPAHMHFCGAIPRHDALRVPSRHLGLFQAGELADLDQQLDAAAGVLVGAGVDCRPPAMSFAAEAPKPPPRLLAGHRVGIAADHAFAFRYRANTELVEAMGAELHYFSPVNDTVLPEVDALWLPGGYPELHAERLAANETMRSAIRAHHAGGRPILAECGGLMYCLEQLIDDDGRSHEMLGLLPGRAHMAGRLMGLGMQSLFLAQGELRGHAFHHSRLEAGPSPIGHTIRQNSERPGEAVFRSSALTATYFHGWFPSSPEATAALLTGSAKMTTEDSDQGRHPVTEAHRI